MKNTSTSHSSIRYFEGINSFLEAISTRHRTSDPLLYCLRLEASDPAVVTFMPPFKKDFYYFGLVTGAGNTRITYDTTDATRLDSFLVFQSPGHIYGFLRGPSAHGYLIYFRKELFSFFRPSFEQEFPFFSLLQTNFFPISSERYKSFQPLMEGVFQAYESNSTHKSRMAALRLLSTLYAMRDFTDAANQWKEGFTAPSQLLLQKYVQLIQNFYLEKRTVEEYAQMLNVTSHHLSHSVKAATGKNALSFINEKILNEAKSLILHTTNDVAEIAYQLGFSDPANFGRFFKKHAGITPLEFRRQAKQK